MNKVLLFFSLVLITKCTNFFHDIHDDLFSPLLQDLVVVSNTDFTYVMHNNGDGDFSQMYLAVDAYTGYYNAVLGDFNHDHRLDIALSTNTTSPEAVILLNNGNGNFYQVFSMTASAGATTGPGRVIASGDLNGDWLPDCYMMPTNVAGPVSYEEVWLNRGHALFEQVSAVTTSKIYTSVALADVDKDGDLDVFLTADGENEIRHNNGHAEFIINEVIPNASYSSQSVALGDLNGDGYPEAVVANLSNDDFIFFNDGKGRFPSVALFSSVSFNASVAVALGDIDGDGDLDVAIADAGGDTSIWSNDGKGKLTQTSQPLLVPVAMNTTDLLFADLDNDGDLDLCTVNSANSNMIWLNDGNGQFYAHPTFVDPLGASNSQAAVFGSLWE